jgi:hypothetical protein
LYLWLIILSVRDDVSIDNEALLMTDLVNLKIKPAQSFRCAHKGRVCVHMFIEVYLRLYYILKKIHFGRMRTGD